jgi:hypothetical protein
VSIERKAVRNDVVEPNLALLYPCEEFVDVFLRGRLTESQRDPLSKIWPSEKLSKAFHKRRPW